VAWLVLGLLGVYAASLLLLSRGEGGVGLQYLLDGRRLTLPAFVATLVTTWYGGILGIGEYAWRFGISTWLVFGVPYYIAAVAFAFLLAPRLRRSEAASIPDLLRTSYGPRAALAGGVAVYVLTIPAAYVLMLVTLLGEVTGWPVWLATVVAVGFSVAYVSMSGFRAVVRTDALQFVLMYGGFAILLPVAIGAIGGFSQLWHALPASHRAWDGGLGWQTILVWYLIALQTMVEPAFYQRVFAAKTPKVARRGVLVSVVCWLVFDFLTTFSGLAARVLLPNLSDPVAAYPALAAKLLPALPYALFMIGLFATVMSTLDSYLFLAAATVGHDLVRAPLAPAAERRRTRWGLLLSGILAAAMALIFGSVVEIWHHVGSVVTSSLLLPVVGLQMPPRFRFSEPGAVTAIVLAAATSSGWILVAEGGAYPLHMEPMFPALLVSAVCFTADLMVRRVKRSGGEMR
jgi:solute:Na+ symporter, SSS family